MAAEWVVWYLHFVISSSRSFISIFPSPTITRRRFSTLYEWTLHVILVDMCPCSNLFGQNHLGWREPRNRPKNIRPPFPRPFVSGSGGLVTRLHISMHKHVVASIPSTPQVSQCATTHTQHTRTSSQGQDALNAQLLGFRQVSHHSLSRLVDAGEVQHRVHAAVVESAAGYSHGTGLTVPSRVARGMPRDVDEQRASLRHAVKATQQVDRAHGRSRGEELQGEPFLAVGNIPVDLFDEFRLSAGALLARSASRRGSARHWRPLAVASL